MQNAFKGSKRSQQVGNHSAIKHSNQPNIGRLTPSSNSCIFLGAPTCTVATSSTKKRPRLTGSTQRLSDTVTQGLFDMGYCRALGHGLRRWAISYDTERPMRIRYIPLGLAQTVAYIAAGSYLLYQLFGEGGYFVHVDTEFIFECGVLTLFDPFLS